MISVNKGSACSEHSPQAYQQQAPLYVLLIISRALLIALQETQRVMPMHSHALPQHANTQNHHPDNITSPALLHLLQSTAARWNADNRRAAEAAVEQAQRNWQQLQAKLGRENELFARSSRSSGSTSSAATK
jgi:hypothetical protein